MRKIFVDKVVTLGFSGAFIFILLQSIVLAVLYSSLPPLLPLYNQLPWGEPRLAIKIEFFIPLGIMVLLFIVNLLLCEKIYKKMPLVARIISLTTLLISFLAFFFVVRTILLIT